VAVYTGANWESAESLSRAAHFETSEQIDVERLTSRTNCGQRCTCHQHNFQPHILCYFANTSYTTNSTHGSPKKVTLHSQGIGSGCTSSRPALKAETLYEWKDVGDIAFITNKLEPQALGVTA
jgi:hypothetical protein